MTDFTRARATDNILQYFCQVAEQVNQIPVICLFTKYGGFDAEDINMAHMNHVTMDQAIYMLETSLEALRRYRGPFSKN